MAEIMMMKTPAEAGLAEAFESAKTALPGDAAARERAFRSFAERGLPHRRVEEFKYTDLRSAIREIAPFAARPSVEEARAAVERAPTLAGVEAARLTLVNGHLVREVSDLDRLPAGVEVRPLAEALASGHPLLDRLGPVGWAQGNPVYQLNSAFMADGALIRIAGEVETPIHLRYVTAAKSAVATATRVLVVVEEGASVTLFESHDSGDGANHQPNDVIELIVGDNAVVNHVRVNAEGRDTLALSTLSARLGAHVSFNSVNTVVGSAMARHQVNVVFAGDHAKAQINGATMIKGRQHADSTLVAEHAALHCESRELFKTVIDDEATGVFQGKIIVQPHAQKTDGRMMSAALLLSEGGTMNNKPELEIFADDVQCAHGATCGQLDEDLLFYIMSRGLPRKKAESLLVQAFLGEAVEFVENESVREALIGRIESWLAARAA